MGQTHRTHNGPAMPRLALQIVMNYEEGAENTILHGDRASEAFLGNRRCAPCSASAI